MEWRRKVHSFPYNQNEFPKKICWEEYQWSTFDQKNFQILWDLSNLMRGSFDEVPTPKTIAYGYLFQAELRSCRADQSRRARWGFQRTETEKSCTSLTIHNRSRNLQTTAYFSWFLLMRLISYLHHAFEFVKSWTMLGYPLGWSESKQKEREGEKIMNRQRTSGGYGSFTWQQFWNKARVFPIQIWSSVQTKTSTLLELVYNGKRKVNLSKRDGSVTELK